MKHPAILQLLHANVEHHFIVTEYHPLGSLDRNLDRFRGDVGGALASLLPITEAVAQLHRAKIVHRDIKLVNIFVADDGRLVLGDFGIVLYSDAAGTRFTETYERVGSRDWMPPWAHTGRRLEDVPPSFDVFALGKVLWCMVSGEPMLPYWYHRRAEHDLERKFPRDPEMAIVNAVLDACVVEHEADCHSSAEMLFGVLSEALRVVRRGGLMLREGVDHPCKLCARGVCKPVQTRGGSLDHKLAVFPADIYVNQAQQLADSALSVRIFRCDFCHNLELFHFPPNEQPRGWLPRKG